MHSAIEGGMLMHRQKVIFPSGSTQCAAWHYAGTNGACVIMAGGFAVTKKPGTDLFAQCFHEAGFSVLAIDYRWLVESAPFVPASFRLTGEGRRHDDTDPGHGRYRYPRAARGAAAVRCRRQRDRPEPPR